MAAGVGTTSSPRHVFVSYSRQDSKAVDRVASHLERAGYRVWIDRSDIRGGFDFSEEIVEAIKTSMAFVIMLSPDSIASAHVRRELNVATASEIPIIPARLREVELSGAFQYYLGDRNHVDLWRRTEKGSLEIVKALGGLRGAAAAAPASQHAAVQDNVRLIAECLRMLQDVTSNAGHVIFAGGRSGQAFVQFACTPRDPSVYGEAVSNNFLPAEHALTGDDVSRLTELGWQSPKEGIPNFFRYWDAHSDDDRLAIAGIAMTTLLDVYGHPPGEKLDPEMQL